MLGKLKTWAAFAGMMLAAILFGLFGMEKARHMKTQARQTKKERDAERLARKKYAEGEKIYNDAVKKINSTRARRGRFTADRMSEE